MLYWVSVLILKLLTSRPWSCTIFSFHYCLKRNINRVIPLPVIYLNSYVVRINLLHSTSYAGSPPCCHWRKPFSRHHEDPQFWGMTWFHSSQSSHLPMKHPGHNTINKHRKTPERRKKEDLPQTSTVEENTAANSLVPSLLKTPQHLRQDASEDSNQESLSIPDPEKCNKKHKNSKDANPHGKRTWR